MKEVRDIKEIVQALRGSGVIAFPTETSYGLLASIYCTTCIEQIFSIKERSKDMVLSVLVKNLEMAQTIAHVNKKELAVFRHFYPGPLTLICTAKKDIPGVTKDGSVALRVSSKKEVQELFNYIDFPLTATSANLSGENDLYSDVDFRENYIEREEKPDMLFMGGALERQKPTTIVDLREDEIQIVRQGKVTIEDINDIIA